MIKRSSRTIACALMLLGLLAGSARASGITNASEDLRTGWYPGESAISPGLLAGGSFGEEWKTSVEGQVYAQPLLENGTLLVPTEKNRVYGLNPATGAVQWSTTLRGTPWDPAEISCEDLTPSIGVTSTPVIDPATNVAYMTHKAYANGSSGAVHWYMDAIEMGSGHELAGFPVELSGNAQNEPAETFEARNELQRPGLLLLEGVVYAAFGSDCDYTPFDGWIFGVSESGTVKASWTAETGDGGSGVWQSGAGLTSDGPGTILFSTGNGNTPLAPTLGSEPPGTLGESVVRVRVQPNGELKATDFFAPFDASTLAGWDADFASGGVTGLPQPWFGTAAVAHLAVAVGKDGYVYLLNRDNLGGIGEGPGGDDKVVQKIGPYGGVWSRPGVWPGEGGWVYIPTSSDGTSAGGSAGNLRVYRYGLSGSGAPTLSLQGTSSEEFGFSSGAPVITSEGTTAGSALVWIEWSPNGGGGGAELRAYEPKPVKGAPVMVWSAPIGTSAKFATPGVGDGRLYVGTRDGQVIAFGSPVSPPLSGPTTTFPATIVGSSSEQTLTLTANEALTIEKLSSSSGQFTIGPPAPALPAAMVADQKIEIPITYTPSTTGLSAATLTVTAQTPSGKKTIPFSLSATGVSKGPKLEGSPRVDELGGTTLGSSRSGTVTFVNEGGAPLTVEAAQEPKPPFFAEGLPQPGAQIGPGEEVTAPTRFEPTELGTFKGEIGLKTSGGNVTLALTGIAAEPGKLVISPETVEFGGVAVGAGASRSFTVSNTGGLGITITKSKPPTGGEFKATTKMAEGETTIGAGESLTETVAFAPTAPGAASGVWLINGEGSMSVHEVLFSGTGITPSVSLTTPIGEQGILSSNFSRLSAVLSSVHLTARAGGAVPVGLRCPGQSASCRGTIELRTRGAVRTSARQRRAAVLVLATGSFNLAAGHSATFTLHLTARARAYLARQRTLRISATLSSSGAPTALVTHTPAAIRLVVPRHR